MRSRTWTLVAGIAALLFGVVGLVRLFTTADLVSFAHLTMAVGLGLFVARDRGGREGSRFAYVPEFLLVVALLQYGYHFLGI